MANNNHPWSTSILEADSIISILLDNLWQDAAQKAITNIMQGLVAADIVVISDQMVGYQITEQNVLPYISKELEPQHVEIDHWADGFIKTQQQEINRTKTTATNISNNTKRVVTKASTIAQAYNQQKAGGKKSRSSNKSGLESEGSIFTRVETEEPSNESEDRMRSAYIATLKQHEQVKRLQQLQLENEEKYKEAQIKFSKQKKHYTYDYTGKILNVGENKKRKPLLSNVSMNIGRDAEVTKRVEKKDLEPEKISEKASGLLSGARKTARNDTKFEFNLESQRQAIQDESTIVQGVKVIQVDGEKQIVKEAKTDKYQSPGMLKFKLREFKDYVKQRRFKERIFQAKAALNTATTPNIPLLAFQSEEQLSIIRKNAQSHQVMNAEEQGHGRKPSTSIKNNLTSKALDKGGNTSAFDIHNITSEGLVVLPEINMKVSQRSSKYFEESARDKNKQRVKSLRVNNEHLESSFYYKQKNSSGRHRIVNNLGSRRRIDSINLNEESFNRNFEQDISYYV